MRKLQKKKESRMLKGKTHHLWQAECVIQLRAAQIKGAISPPSSALSNLQRLQNHIWCTRAGFANNHHRHHHS